MSASASPSQKLTDKTTLAQLAQMGGVSTLFMHQLVRATIAIIEAGLLRDGIVKIHNFGTFRLAATKSAVPEVVFQPAKNVRELVMRALGPTVHTGSRVSLPALLEKHWGALAPPQTAEHVAPAILEQPAAVEPAPEEFDINERLPDLPEALPPRFTFGETAAEEKKPATAAADTVMAPPVRPAPANGKPLNNSAHQHPLAESPAPAFSADLFGPNRVPPKSAVPPRHRTFAWRLGAAAALALLLLFVLPNRLGEKSKRVTDHATPQTTPVVALTNGKAKAEAASVPAEKTPPIAPPFFAGGTHRVIPDDNLWKIAGHYYRDPYLWPTIYRANAGALPEPNILAHDQQLALPVLYGPPAQLTLEDRHNLAASYFLLYRHYRAHEPALAPFALWAAVRYDGQIKSEYAAELRADDWAFLRAHGVKASANLQKVTER